VWQANVYTPPTLPSHVDLTPLAGAHHLNSVMPKSRKAFSDTCKKNLGHLQYAPSIVKNASIQSKFHARHFVLHIGA
jgi:hypothetical protein